MAAKAAVSSECCESELTTESTWICGAPWLPIAGNAGAALPKPNDELVTTFFVRRGESGFRTSPRSSVEAISVWIGADRSAENTHAEVEKAISAPAVPTSHACPTRCAPLQRRATNPKAVGDDRPHRQSKKCYGQRFVLPPKKERCIS